MSRRRHADMSTFTRRLTPAEVAKHWFRRGADYAKQIHGDHPDFPKAGPDGLYLLKSVEDWFDRFHGAPQPRQSLQIVGSERALEIARGGR
jgi:hypothetical protein